MSQPEHKPLSVQWYMHEIVRCRNDVRKAREAENRARARRKRAEADLSLTLSGMETALAQETKDQNGC